MASIWRRGLYPLAVAAAGTAAWGAHRLRAWQFRARFDAVLAERNRIAREIHDTLAQDLLGAALQVEGALGSFGTSPAATLQHLERARELIHESLASARRSVWDLRDPTLVANDLGSALASFAEKAIEDSPARLELRLSGQPRPLPQEVAEHLLRIGREAITNAVRHAGAERILIALSFYNDRVILRIKDDGGGFIPGQSSDDLSFGLITMAERAAQLAARLEIRSEQGKGTDVEVEASL
jgi:signal transduction histidine kinase